MEYTRRMFVEAILNFTFAAASSSLGLLSRSRKRDEYRDYMSLEIPDIRELGTNPPKKAEVEKAQALLATCPAGVAPIEAMKYLASLPDRNQEDEAYNAGWSDRWNPVIVTFFDYTQRKPSGDETFWCAACLNWVLHRSGYKPTCSASSCSFRHAGKETLSPAPGDIVVFVHTDQDLARAGRGHVGLFVSRTEKKVKVLGGNQKNKYGHHAICEQEIPLDGTYKLLLHSFRELMSFPKTTPLDGKCRHVRPRC